MKVSIECTYCGHKWVEILYHKSALDGKFCPNGSCKHKQFIVKDLNDKIDVYKNCPPFPEKKKKEERWPYGMD